MLASRWRKWRPCLQDLPFGVRRWPTWIEGMGDPGTDRYCSLMFQEDAPQSCVWDGYSVTCSGMKDCWFLELTRAYLCPLQHWYQAHIWLLVYPHLWEQGLFKRRLLCSIWNCVQDSRVLRSHWKLLNIQISSWRFCRHWFWHGQWGIQVSEKLRAQKLVGLPPEAMGSS